MTAVSPASWSFLVCMLLPLPSGALLAGPVARGSRDGRGTLHWVSSGLWALLGVFQTLPRARPGPGAARTAARSRLEELRRRLSPPGLFCASRRLRHPQLTEHERHLLLPTPRRTAYRGATGCGHPSPAPTGRDCVMAMSPGSRRLRMPGTLQGRGWAGTWGRLRPWAPAVSQVLWAVGDGSPASSHSRPGRVIEFLLSRPTETETRRLRLRWL